MRSPLQRHALHLVIGFVLLFGIGVLSTPRAHGTDAASWGSRIISLNP